MISACATPPRADPSVRSVLAAQQAAWNRGDLEGFMAGYARSPELVFTSGGKIRRGYAETYARYRAKYGGDHTGMGHLEFDIISIQSLGVDGAIVLGRWRLTETSNAGSGIFSVALERTNAGWRIVHDHTSLDAP
jgi:beta-aspartyl-peptidase (threonine type)